MAKFGNDGETTGRAAAVARRRAMAGGKAQLGGSAGRTGGRRPEVHPGSAAVSPPSPVVPVTPMESRPVGAPAMPRVAVGEGRAASIARRRAMASGGKRQLPKQRTREVAQRPEVPEPEAVGTSETSGRRHDEAAAPATPTVAERRDAVRLQPEGRLLAMARRQAQTRGKAALQGLRNGSAGKIAALALETGGDSDAARGRRVAMAVREARCENGRGCDAPTRPSGRRRADPPSSEVPPKVPVSETSRGQKVTGTLVGRSKKTTGDEPGSCRSVTGSQYLAADLVRTYCGTEPTPEPQKVGASATFAGRTVTGTMVGRGAQVTGNEPGTCQRVTGSEYVSAEQEQSFCGRQATPSPAKVKRVTSSGGQTVTGVDVGRAQRVTGNEVGADRALTGTPYTASAPGGAPLKVGATRTFAGGGVTGTSVGRSARVTGDEPGTCQRVTGDEYVGAEQYAGFCGSVPEPSPPKVEVGPTWLGQSVSGTRVGRSRRVTGDEAGSCGPISGTSYVGPDQYQTFCGPDAEAAARDRKRSWRSTPGAAVTGGQPGIAGRVTGTGKGACEPISGTPYVGADQYRAACDGNGAAEPGEPDFPQPLQQTPWQGFSVLSPARAADQQRRGAGVTGTRYDQGERITGAFGHGRGVVTGTEDFRSAQGAPALVPVQAASSPGPATRITGEGMDSGLRITGDDWARGERVTGTEGTSSVARNPTRRGQRQPAFAGATLFRGEGERPVAQSPVTGSSGYTERGSLVTVSGGARG